MGQSKAASMIEQLCNVGTGFLIAVFLWHYVVTPYLGIEYDIKQNLYITTLFTVVSMLRGYIFRRIGNYITKRYKK